MKRLVDTYTFNAASKTVTLPTFTTVSLNHVLLITNVTSNVIIYNFASNALGATVSGNILTLTYNTTSMSNSDVLQIYYDYPDGTFDDLLLTMRAILNMMPYPDTAQRARVLVDTSSQILVQPNITATGGYSYINQPSNEINIQYAVQVRPGIRVSN